LITGQVIEKIDKNKLINIKPAEKELQQEEKN